MPNSISLMRFGTLSKTCSFTAPPLATMGCIFGLMLPEVEHEGGSLQLYEDKAGGEEVSPSVGYANIRSQRAKEEGVGDSFSGRMKEGMPVSIGEVSQSSLQ